MDIQDLQSCEILGEEGTWDCGHLGSYIDFVAAKTSRAYLKCCAVYRAFKGIRSVSWNCAI